MSGMGNARLAKEVGQTPLVSVEILPSRGQGGVKPNPNCTLVPRVGNIS